MTENNDVDKGFAWILLLGSFCVYLLVLGSLNAYGILYTEMLTYFQAGAGNTAWISSLSLLFQHGLALASNTLSMTYSFRVTVCTGGVLVGAGWVLSSFMPRIEYLYITYGVIGGIGYGLIYSPCITIVSFYFKKKRVFANCVLVSASGVGTLVLPFLMTYLLENYGWRGTMLIVGGLLFNICAGSCLFVQPRSLKGNKRHLCKRFRFLRKTKQSSDFTTECKKEDDAMLHTNTKKEISNMFSCGLDFALFHNVTYILYFIAFIFSMLGQVNNFIMVPARIQSLGYDRSYVVLSVSIFGGSEIIARLFFGYIADKGLMSQANIFIMCEIISAIFAFLTPFFPSFWYMAIYAWHQGTFTGIYCGLMSVMTIKAVGFSKFPQASGLLIMFMGVCSLLSQPVVGWLDDLTGTWDASFILNGCYLLIAGLLVAAEPYLTKNRPKLDEEQHTMDEANEKAPLPSSEPTNKRNK